MYEQMMSTHTVYFLRGRTMQSLGREWPTLFSTCSSQVLRQIKTPFYIQINASELDLMCIAGSPELHYLQILRKIICLWMTYYSLWYRTAFIYLHCPIQMAPKYFLYTSSHTGSSLRSREGPCTLSLHVPPYSVSNLPVFSCQKIYLIKV